MDPVPANIRVLGALQSPPDPRDFKLADVATLAGMTAPAQLPSSVDLSKAQPRAIRDQGREGACVGYSSAAAREYHIMALQHGVLPGRLSPQYIYDLRANFPTPGMALRDALNILRKSGVCPDASCPPTYLDAVPCAKDAQTDVLASSAKIASYYSIATVDDARVALYDVGPILIMFNVWQTTDPTRPLWQPIPGREPDGAHAVCVEAYFDDPTTPGQGHFVFRNSWGTSWGTDGYGVMPYSQWQMAILEAWVMVPLVSSGPAPAPPAPSTTDAPQPLPPSPITTTTTTPAAAFSPLDLDGEDKIDDPKVMVGLVVAAVGTGVVALVVVVALIAAFSSIGGGSGAGTWFLVALLVALVTAFVVILVRLVLKKRHKQQQKQTQQPPVAAACPHVDKLIPIESLPANPSFEPRGCLASDNVFLNGTCQDPKEVGMADADYTARCKASCLFNYSFQGKPQTCSE